MNNPDNVASLKPDAISDSLHATSGSAGCDSARLAGVRFSYDHGATWALDGIDLTVHAGEWLCLTGSNGSGKSTLSRLLAGLAAPDDGDVVLLGRHVFDASLRRPDSQAYRDARHGIGAVFQNPEDQIVTTVVMDDVAFGPENLGVGHDEIGSRITQALQAVDMNMQRDEDPTRMSGGQQQRVAIAGMLAMRPRMLVLDEPTAMLDEAARADVMRILARLHDAGTTIVLVTHHEEETAQADRIIQMDHGRIIAETRCSSSLRHSGRNHTAAPDIAAFGKAYANVQDVPARQDETGTSNPISHSDSASIIVDHLSYRYADRSQPVIDDLSLTIDSGQTVAIMGPNGAGKSTLARLLCALERPAAGSITVAGISVARACGNDGKPRMLGRRGRETLRRKVGYVMQHPERQLFADTVAEDVAYGPRNQQLDEQHVQNRVAEALKLLHIEHLASRSPFALSGGQQRLAAIAGVIACQPDVIIMDEATASLDAEATARIHEMIRTLRSRGVTVVMITHDRQEARTLADRIITMEPPRHDAPETRNETADNDDAAEHRNADRNEYRENDGRKGHASSGLAARTERSGGDRRSSFVDAWDPRVKMLSILALMFTAFAIVTPWQLIAGAAMTACVIAVARLHPLRLVASVHMFLVVFALMGAVNVFFVRSGDVLAQWGHVAVTSGGVMVAVLYSCRLAMVILLGAVFLETTTPVAMTDAFESLLSPLRRFGWHTQEVALVMSLALRFLPTLGDEVRAIIDAQSARGGSIETGSPARRIRAMVAIIVPVFAGALRHADNLGLALDARCYEEGANRTHWRVMKVRGSDVAAGLLCMLYIAGLVSLRML